MAALDLAAAPLLPLIWGIGLAVIAVVGALTGLILVVQDLWTGLNGGKSALVEWMNKSEQLKMTILQLFGPLIVLLGLLKSFNAESPKDKTFNTHTNSTETRTVDEKTGKRRMPDPMTDPQGWANAKLLDRQASAGSPGSPEGPGRENSSILLRLASLLLGIKAPGGKSAPSPAPALQKAVRAAVTQNPAQGLERAALAPSNTSNHTTNVRQENNVDITVTGSRDPVRTGQTAADSLKKVLSDAAYQIPAAS